jgi:hypothetical protein
VWSPALVVFAGGSPGVSAWFPLGPGEPYRPWYPCSPRYIDVVNISNITVTNVVHVQTTYVNFNFDTVVFANRAHGYTAIRNEDFASGRSASQVTVNVDVHIFDHVQVLKAPEPRPTAQSFVGHAPARPVRVPSARPVLINENGMAVAAKPGAAPSAPPVKAAPTVRPLPGRKTVAPPPSARTQPVKTESAPAPRQEEKPATPAKPAEKPAPADKQAPVVKPGTPEHPAANPPKAGDKPGDKPGAANDKNKKNDKDKEKKDQPQ